MVFGYFRGKYNFLGVKKAIVACHIAVFSFGCDGPQKTIKGCGPCHISDNLNLFCDKSFFKLVVGVIFRKTAPEEIETAQRESHECYQDGVAFFRYCVVSVQCNTQRS